MTTPRETQATGLTRRGVLRGFVLGLLSLPLLKLSETVARADRRRRNHTGQNQDLWIGHC